MAKLPSGKKKKNYRLPFVKHSNKKNNKNVKLPENCTYCVHRLRDTSEKHEIETCEIHGHQLPIPIGEVVEDVPGCETCVARWCPQFEQVTLDSKPFEQWFQEEFGNESVEEG